MDGISGCFYPFKFRFDFILKTFKPHERAILDTVFTRAADAIETIISDGRERAMNTSNRPTQKVPSVL